MKLEIAIVMAVMVSIVNYCYMQKYHNKTIGEYVGIESFFKPWTTHRAFMFVVMLASIVAMTFYIVNHNDEENFIFIMRRVFCYAVLWPAATIDAREHKIPNQLLLIALLYKVGIVIAELICCSQRIVQVIVSEFIVIMMICAVCFVCRLIIKDGICMGDIKLMIVMALLLGGSSFFNAIFVSMWIVFLEAVVVLMAKKKKKSDSIAFAPSVLIGTSISMILTGC